MPLGKAQPCGQEKRRAAADLTDWYRASSRGGPSAAGGSNRGGGSRALRAMAGGPPKALLSTGPQSLRDMPHPLAGSSSEEAVGGDSTPSPDLLMARSFGDKVGCLGLGTPAAERGRVMDQGPPLTLGRAHSKAPFPGIRRALPLEPLTKACPLGAPAGSQLQPEWPGGMCFPV